MNILFKITKKLQIIRIQEKKHEGITKSLLGMKTNRRIIFYRIFNENYVEITKILHERMDLKKRMKE